MQFAANILVLGLALFFAQEWLRRKPHRVAYAAFFALPLLLTPLWALGNAAPLCQEYDGPWFFCWLKTCSVSVAACWFTKLRFTELQRDSLAQSISLLVLPINIVEAVIQGFVCGTLPHYLNGIAGLLLVITLPYSPDALRPQARGACRDLDYCGLNRAWIFGYTIWNFVFVYLIFPVVAGQQLAVLAAALVVGMLEPRRWLQARTYTLAFSCYLLFSFPQVVVSRIGTAAWSTPGGELLGAFLSLGFMSVFAAALLGIRLCEFVRDPFRWSISCRQIVFEK